jgi:hypothetical protein
VAVHGTSISSNDISIHYALHNSSDDFRYAFELSLKQVYICINNG